MTRNAANVQRKRNTTSRETPTIALKTILNDIVRDNKTSTLTDKKMRAKLRVAMRATHEHNASWMFTTSQYDVVRSMFDPAYASRVAKRAKRDTQKRATPNVVVVEHVEVSHDNA